jgi:hypothetical protein
VHLLCNERCLQIALRTLGVTSESPNRSFKEPLSIRVGVPYPYSELPSPLKKSPLQEDLTKISDEEDVDMKQIKVFGEKK